MGCLSGASSGTTITTATVSDEADVQQVMNDRKRKRMESNRESARRSRMRKQKHLDDLTAQVDILRRDNGRLLTAVQTSTLQLLNVEAENSVLTAQIAELSNRLHSLTQILTYLNSGAGSSTPPAGFIGNHWGVNQNQNQNQNQAVMVSDYQVFGY